MSQLSFMTDHAFEITGLNRDYKDLCLLWLISPYVSYHGSDDTLITADSDRIIHATSEKKD